MYFIDYLWIDLQELNDIRSSSQPTLKNISVDETNIFVWTGQLHPVSIYLFLVF